MDIRDLCYELYKIDWRSSHVSRDEELKAMKNYYNNLDDYNCMYETYIEENGYNGFLYACYDEFCENEYRDKKYICSLLGNEQLIGLYIKDIDNELELNENEEMEEEMIL